MARRLTLIVWFGLALTALIFPARTMVRGAGNAGEALVLTSNGPLTPAMLEYLQRGIRLAERDNAEVLIFQMNTPGGSIDLMNSMIEMIRASTVPVVVYVAPSGAMAGSAGTLITLAGHAAAMAPATTIGAASPVGSGGAELDPTIARKEKEILKATARSLTEWRGTAAMTLAENAIENAQAVSSSEARAANLIDVVASDVPDLLRQLNGFTVAINGSPRPLRTANLQVVTIPISFIEQILAMLTDPNIVLVLMAVGVQAILIELSSPGGWVAGFVGVVCLALAGYGLGILPVNWFGLVFLAVAFVLFVLDIKAPTHGALTVAGAGSFIVGALTLFNSPGVPAFERVSVPLVVVTALAFAGSFFIILTFALRAQRSPLRSGRKLLVGRTGVARTDLDPDGMVQVAAETWSARLEEGESRVEKGTPVEVVAVEGIHLRVRRSAL